MAFNLNWKGDEVRLNAIKGVSGAMTEFGLRCETAAKRRLQPGHGVITGTLRRSVHTATPGYNWRADNVKPLKSAPERGGQEAFPALKNGNLTLELGSGLEYAMAVHQGHGSFEGYHYMTEAVVEQKPKLPAILEKHAKLKRARK
jgi:hypothetical protein